MSDTTDDLGWAALHDDCACGNPNPAQDSARELAGEITRLRAELAEAQRERDGFREECQRRRFDLLDAERDRDAAKAEVERLREAIDAIHIYADDTLSGRADGPTTREWLREGIVETRKRARAALQETAHD